MKTFFSNYCLIAVKGTLMRTIKASLDDGLAMLGCICKGVAMSQSLKNHGVSCWALVEQPPIGVNANRGDH